MLAYSSKFDLDDIVDISKRIFSNSTITKTDDSIFFEHNDGNWIITKESYIEYTKNGYTKEVYDEIYDIEDYDIDFITILKDFISYKQITKDRINRNSVTLELNIVSVQLYSSGKYLVTFNQTINGYEINQFFTVIFDKENIVSIKGDLKIVFPEKVLKCENASLIDIIIEEKRSIQDDGETREIESVKFEYEIYYEDENTYFLPICVLVYSQGEESSYDFVIGSKN